ncbi:MAG: penicillin-binding protein activator, partial [Gammaproteobacteria bacterium]|nr:penicillin-binding protein activator [Gammaproteobacteria bacterium]
MLQSISPKYLALLSFAFLSACTTVPDKNIDDAIVSDAVLNQATEDDFVSTDQQTPEYYIKLASNSTGETQQKYLIKAAELYYQRGNISSALSQLENIKPVAIASSQQIQIQLLTAKIALANNNPARAIELLPRQKKMAIAQFIETGEVRADANFAMGYFMEAIKTRVWIDAYYINDEQREANHSAIWSALNALPSVVLDKLKSSNKALQGWLELARIIRSAQINNHDLQNSILDWGTEFPEHPASNLFISRLLDEHINTQTGEHVIAVLLPLHGPYQAATEAIKGGLLSAYYANRKQGHKPTIRFYDTSKKDMDFVALYQKAVQEGASYIIGPLNKSGIHQLIQSNAIGDEFKIPVLTLNYAEDSSDTTNNLYQFGLLPEDEAKQAAELAIRQNKTR